MELEPGPPAPAWNGAAWFARLECSYFGYDPRLKTYDYRAPSVIVSDGCNVWLIMHARMREELSQTFPDAHFTVDFVSRLAARLEQRKLVRSRVAEHGIDVIHDVGLWDAPPDSREGLIQGFADAMTRLAV